MAGFFGPFYTSPFLFRQQKHPMRLTAHTGYALRVLLHLAANGGGLATTPEVAERYGISQSHLTKVVHGLGRAGFVDTVRGRGGGFRLAGPADSITLGSVLRCTEAKIPLAECFPGGAGTCRIAPCCVFRNVVAVAHEAFFAVLDRFTIQDLLQRDPRLVRLFAADSE